MDEQKPLTDQQIDYRLPDKSIDAQTKIKDHTLKADKVDITDTGDHYTGTETETALQEIGESLTAIEGGSLDTRYLIIDTKANILADSSPIAGKIGYATDTLEFYLYDGTNWKVAPLELETETATPDMGAYNADGLGVSDKAGYYKYPITDKNLSNVRILGNARDEEGAIRTTTSGIFQIYLNGVWNDVVINFVLREDASGTYELEHAPVGFNWYYEVMSGNSDNIGIDGKPVVQNYSSSMGAYQRDLEISGGEF